MPNIMLVGKAIPENLSINILDDCFKMMRDLQFGDDDAVITTCESDRNNEEGEEILMYGFNIENPYSDGELPYKIMKEAGIATRLIPSQCKTVGEACESSPHVVVITKPRNIKGIIHKLKCLKLGHDVEIHLIGSNVSYKAKQQEFYVRIKLLEEEAEQLKCIIDGLMMRLGIFREQIWASIINDFIPADKMM